MLSPRQEEMARDMASQYMIPLDKTRQIIADVEQLILDGKIERAKEALFPPSATWPGRRGHEFYWPDGSVAL